MFRVEDRRFSICKLGFKIEGSRVQKEEGFACRVPGPDQGGEERSGADAMHLVV